MALLHRRRLLLEFVTVVLDFGHGLLQFVETFVVPSSHIDNVVFPLLQKIGEGAECSEEEHWCEVEDVLLLFMETLCEVLRRKVDPTDGVEHLRIQFFLLLLVIGVFLLGGLWVACPLINLLVVLLDEDFLTDLLQVLHIQLLNPDHLGVEHEVLVPIHLLTEVLPTRSEVEDQLEVLAHTLQEEIVELVLHR